MSDSSAFALTIAGLIFLTTLSVFIIMVVAEHKKTIRNRVYKTLEEHRIANSVLKPLLPQNPPESELPEEVPMNRFAMIVAPLAQLVLISILLVVILSITQHMDSQDDALRIRIDKLDAQIHALAFAPLSTAAPASRADADPASGDAWTQGVAGPVNPVQQACAHIAERAAIAYDKPDGAKVASSLQALMKDLGCAPAKP